MTDQGGDKYAQVISDGQQTVMLTGAIVELVGRPLSSIWRKRSATQAFKEKLGEWADEAVDRKGRCLQPVLRSRAFEDHLVRENGYFQPTGQCDSSFAWAQLLYALNIRPGGGVIAWRLPPKGINPAVAGDVALEVDGAAMCHIINIFRLYKKSAPEDFNRCSFPFGRLSIDQNGAKFTATFEPGTQDDLREQRVPFSYRCWAIPGSYLLIDKEVVVANYFNAIHYDISDAAEIGGLPNPNQPMKDRASFLLRALELLRSGGLDHAFTRCPRICTEAWHKPRLITRKWMEEMSRIKRRVTTNGGEDMSLIEYIVSSLADRPNFVAEVNHSCSIFLRSAGEQERWKPLVRSWLDERCMSSQSGFSSYWTQSSPSTGLMEQILNRLMLKELPSVLENLKMQPEGSWLKELSTMVSDLIDLLTAGDDLINAPLLVLGLGADHSLWQGTCEVRGQ
ncbi:hypothetical protein N7494_003608 [Penicillium frequentans]|uniref:Uncharacterized protein n=1 Tax=Penicillium frequentans TaxID=3151616 RepID=A0AAD6D1H9_9EURO|nr:hypothetical protein N7494_003608 [Penicillium glabrum]